VNKLAFPAKKRKGGEEREGQGRGKGGRERGGPP